MSPDLMPSDALTVRSLLPPAPFLRRIIWRSIVIWIGVRGTLGILAILGSGVLPPEFALALPATVMLLAVVAALGMLDLIRRHERLFLGNLGIGDHTLVGVTLVVPALLEGFLQVVW